MIAIIIPTLDIIYGERAGTSALRRTGIKARLIISAGPRRGFTKTVNDGIRQTKNEDICLLNDDVSEFPSGWLIILYQALYSNPKYGIAGPSGASATAPANTGKPGMHGVQVVGQLPFWCVLIRRELIDAIGLLDEDFIHYGSDNWYCIQTREAGWQCVWVRSVYLKHQHRVGGPIVEWAKKDRAMLMQKIHR